MRSSSTIHSPHLRGLRDLKVYVSPIQFGDYRHTRWGTTMCPIECVCEPLDGTDRVAHRHTRCASHRCVPHSMCPIECGTHRNALSMCTTFEGVHSMLAPSCVKCIQPTLDGMQLDIHMRPTLDGAHSRPDQQLKSPDAHPLSQDNLRIRQQSTFLYFLQCCTKEAIKAPEMLVAPRISECFGLPWSALVCYSLL